MRALSHQSVGNIGRWALLLMMVGGTARADVTLPRIFGNNQLLQQGTNTAIWGWASPSEAITVQLQGTQPQTQNTTADGSGNWNVKLATLAATTNVHTLAVSGTNNTITITNVVIGDVWFCAGQSNMDMPMSGVSNSATELADADYPFIRLFQVRPASTGMNMAVDIQFKSLNSSATNEGWSASRNSSAGLYSAVAWSFARALHKTNGVPIGLIQVSVGATCCDQYVDPQAFIDDPRFGPSNGFSRTNIFNGSIAPITKFAIRGAIWYQGECEGNSATGGWGYRDTLDVLLRNWRSAFPSGDFPFIAVQIHNWGAQDATKHWDELRDSQSTVLLTNNAALVVGVDVGDPLNLHPANKVPLGQRAALAARALAYGETNLIHQGPVLASQQVAGTNVTLTFTSVGTGLVVRGTGGTLKGFQIAGGNSNYVNAIATILSSNQLVVNSPRIAAPVAVRYGWYFNPQEANLVNSAHLPANVFRTDNFGLFTGGPNKLGDLTFRGDATLVSNEASTVFRGDLRRTGVYPESGPTLLSNLAWSFDTGAKVRSTVAVKDGTVVFSSNNTNIYAVALANGSPLWQFNAGSSAYSLALNQTHDFAAAPVFAEGVVMVPMKDKLIVLNPADGSYRYSFEAQPAYADGDDRVASPTLVDDTVLFGGVARLYGLAPRTGHVKVYRTLHWNGASPAFTRSAAAVEDGMAYFTEPTFFSINLTNLAVAGYTINDSTINTKPAPTAVAPCAAISGGSALFTRSNQVLSVSLSTRATNWIFTAAANIDSSPAVFNGKAYVGCNDGNLYALDLATGASNWTFATAGAVKSSPALAGDLIYFGSLDGKVYSVNTNGALVSSYQTGGAIYSSPVLKDGVVLIGSDDGRVYALNGTAPTFLTVSYSGNGSTGGTPPSDSTEYQPSDTVTVLGNTNGLARNGFLFNGWNTAANGSGASYAPGGTFSLGASGLTLYAQWVDDPNTFTVTYEGNGSTGGNAPVDPTAYYAGDTVTVSNRGTLVKTGFSFSGWNTTANGSGTSYLAGSTFVMGATPVTLHAIWTVLSSDTLMTYEGFDLAAGEDALANTSGASSFGWSGVWTNTTVDIASGLTYGQLQTVEGAARLDTAGSGAHRGLGATINTGTTWLSVIMVVSNPASYAGLSLYNNFGNERFFLGDTDSGTNWGIHSPGLTPAYLSSSNTLKPSFLVMRIEWSAGPANSENVYLWINPALDAEPVTASCALAILGTNFNPGGSGEHLTRMRIQQGSAGDNTIIDEIRIGRTWSDVAPVDSSPNPDIDGDGLPNDWETTYFGGETNGNPSALAANGINTVLDCYIADLHPNATASLFEVTGISPAVGGGMVMTFPASTGRYYQLRYATNGPAAAWSVTNLGWGTGDMRVTNPTHAVWLGGVQVRLQPPDP